MEGTQFIEISWTSGSLDEARRVARYLVQERIVAGAQISPWVEAIYLWDNQLETTQETRVTFRTARDRFDEVVKIIKENSGYEIPEIAFTAIEGGDAAYLEWMKQ